MVAAMDDDLYPSQKADRIMVRLPGGLRDRLNSRAKSNGRSANAEVVMALEAWLDRDLDISKYVEMGQPVLSIYALIEILLSNIMSNPDYLVKLLEARNKLVHAHPTLGTDKVLSELLQGVGGGPKTDV